MSDDLISLGTEDSLVVFFAGHGRTVRDPYDGGYTEAGYLIPYDADMTKRHTWIELNSWLNLVSRLPPKHILVILDSCNSGIALDPASRWRSEAPPLPQPIEQLTKRRSRRVITASLGDQYASDAGPTQGHSLFTGCLIEALTGGVGLNVGYATGTWIAAYIQQRVTGYSRSMQTPDFGTLEHDQRGELVVSLHALKKASLLGAEQYPPRDQGPAKDVKQEGSSRQGEFQSPKGATPRVPSPTGGKESFKPLGKEKPKHGSLSATEQRLGQSHGKAKPASSAGKTPPRPNDSASLARPNPTATTARARPALRAGAGTLSTLVAESLDRQNVERSRGTKAIALLAGESSQALTSLATWSARHGRLTLSTQSSDLASAVAILLSHMPWLRCLPEARTRFAAAAKLKVDAIDAAFDSRSGLERENWISSIAFGDISVRLSGWLLSTLKNSSATLDPSDLELPKAELLSSMGALIVPISILLHCDDPTEKWLMETISTAATLATYLPLHTVALSAPKTLVERVLKAGRKSTSMMMAERGVVDLDAPISRRGIAATKSFQPPSPDLLAIEKKLVDALSRDPRTRGKFEHQVRAPVHERGRDVEVLLAARSERLIVELDAWYHLSDPQAYQRDRLKSVSLQRAGFFELRFPVEDVEQRITSVLDEVALGLDSRRGVEPSF
jgi:very-short-patch-repair endonuclease